jgi:hypothetical protein
MAAQSQPEYPLDASLELMRPDSPWRPGCPGDRFHQNVLSLLPTPTTVGEAIELGKRAGFKEDEVQDHLKYLFTSTGPRPGPYGAWGGKFIRIDGKLYAPNDEDRARILRDIDEMIASDKVTKKGALEWLEFLIDDLKHRCEALRDELKE